MACDNRPVGMFDSGMGGISVLREAVRQLPDERFVFYGDTLHAPYGTKTREEVLRLSGNVTDTLLSCGIKALVIACNTASSAAAAALREKYDLPIIAMEPALKPASVLHRDGLILALATPGTLAGEKYAQLYAKYGQGVASVPCPGLMEFVERGEMDTPQLHDYLDKLLAPYRECRVEATVLGCTHYVFLKKALARHLPGVPLVDGNAGTVRQLERRLTEAGMLAGKGNGGVTFMTSGDDTVIERMKTLFVTE